MRHIINCCGMEPCWPSPICIAHVLKSSWLRAVSLPPLPERKMAGSLHFGFVYGFRTYVNLSPAKGGCD